MYCMFLVPYVLINLMFKLLLSYRLHNIKLNNRREVFSTVLLCMVLCMYLKVTEVIMFHIVGCFRVKTPWKDSSRLLEKSKFLWNLEIERCPISTFLDFIKTFHDYSHELSVALIDEH